MHHSRSDIPTDNQHRLCSIPTLIHHSSHSHTHTDREYYTHSHMLSMHDHTLCSHIDHSSSHRPFDRHRLCASPRDHSYKPCWTTHKDSCIQIGMTHKYMPPCYRDYDSTFHMVLAHCNSLHSTHSSLHSPPETPPGHSGMSMHSTMQKIASTIYSRHLE